MRRLVGHVSYGLFGLAACVACTVAGATAYRCDDAGRITYTNLPCTSGKQTELVERSAAPTAEDRAAAANRARADRAKLDAIERDRARERQGDQRAAAIAARKHADRMKQSQSCSKLATKARRAREDYETAGPRDQVAKRTRMRRAEDDYATACRKR